MVKKFEQKIENLTTAILKNGQFVAAITDKLSLCGAKGVGQDVPRQFCVFRTDEQNKSHTSGRCQQYPDVVTRALRVAAL